jgi:hypothetical protein
MTEQRKSVRMNRMRLRRTLFPSFFVATANNRGTTRGTDGLCHVFQLKSEVTEMINVKKTVLAAMLAGATALPMTSAQAWWGGPGWGGPGYGSGYNDWLGDGLGDMWGDGDFSMNFSGRGSGRGYGRGYGYNDYYRGYGYGPYGYGAPYGYGGGPWGYPGYGYAPYGAAPVAPAAPAAPASK